MRRERYLYSIPLSTQEEINLKEDIRIIWFFEWNYDIKFSDSKPMYCAGWEVPLWMKNSANGNFVNESKSDAVISKIMIRWYVIVYVTHTDLLPDSFLLRSIFCRVRVGVQQQHYLYNCGQLHKIKPWLSKCRGHNMRKFTWATNLFRHVCQ
jgi:hypothetical protein